jgi:hypothetical protein
VKLRQLGANQTEVELTSSLTVFFSYQTPVACNVAGEGFYKSVEFHSRTTSKHITQWLNGAHAIARPQAYFDGLVETTRAKEGL